MSLPPTAEAALARAIGAYLRDAPASDVPAKLRPIARFRDQALKPHRARLIAALEKESFRGKVLEWLDDSPPLRAGDARALSIAARREDGWEELLVAAVPEAPSGSGGDEVAKLGKELERERAKLVKLKEEARAQRETGRAALREEKKRSADLVAEIRDLKASTRALESELRSTRTELERATAAADKEKRSLRRNAERAAAARSKAEERTTALKREVAAARREIRELRDLLERERVKKAGSRRAAPPRPRDPGARRRLRAPKGLLDDAPETLEAWLKTGGVRLVVDGYNVGKATTGFPGLKLEQMRKRLVDEVAKLARRHGVETTIVFDGAEVAPGTRRLRRPPVKVEYSPAGVIADDVIVDRVRDAPPDPVIVATNDKGLRERVRELGATVATSDQLLALFRGRNLS